MIQRNCIVLFLLLLCMLNLSVQAQEKRITASFSDISLSEAMWRIEQSIGYTFFLRRYPGEGGAEGKLGV